jgi:hypothetical protein
VYRLLPFKFIHLIFGGITAACLLIVSGMGDHGSTERILRVDEGLQLPLVHGSEMTSEDLLSAEDRLIIFSILDCLPCEGIYPHLRSLGSELPVLLVFVAPSIWSDGDRIKTLVEERSMPQPVGMISMADAKRIFDVSAYPMALRINRRGRVLGEGKGVEQILQLSRLPVVSERIDRIRRTLGQ